MEQQWISVKDRLPEIPPEYIEDGVRVKPLSINVIVYDGEDVYQGSYMDGFFRFNGVCYTLDVLTLTTH